MAVDPKKVLLNLAEEDVKVLINELLKPELLDLIEKKLPGSSAIVGPLVSEACDQLLKLADKIDGEVG
jgi:hypothetical protein